MTQNEKFSYTTSPTFLQRVKSGSETAWIEFYRKYAGMIRHIGQQKDLTPEECDDLMIEVMTIFWRKIDNFFYEPERGKFRSYLKKISDFAAMRMMKHKRKEESLGNEELPEYPGEVESSCMEEWQDFIIEKALEELSLAVDTESYQIFYMSFFQKRPAKSVSSHFLLLLAQLCPSFPQISSESKPAMRIIWRTRSPAPLISKLPPERRIRR